MSTSAASFSAGWLDYLSAVVTLTKQVGAEIMVIYASADIGATSKADNSPLTPADLAVQLSQALAGGRRCCSFLPAPGADDGMGHRSSTCRGACGWWSRS